MKVGTIKKAEHQRIDAFKLWSLRRLLGGPWTARRFNQSMLKEVNPEYSWEGLMAGVEAPILWPSDAEPTDWKRPNAEEKTLKAKEAGRRG